MFDWKKPTVQMLGRWQPWHDGHQWLIDQRLKENKNVLVCIRDMEPDKNNPYTCEEVYDNLQIELKGLIDLGRVKVMIIPDIESVNYGRFVLSLIIFCDLGPSFIKRSIIDRLSIKLP